MSTKMADTFLESKFLSLEDRLRAENEAPRINPTERMTLDFNTEPPFVRQGSGRRPGPLPLQPNGTPTRIRRNLDIAGISNAAASCSANSKQSEIEARLQEIIKLTGIITINGQKYHSSIHDLEHQGELGFGSCGHVVKMRHPPSNAIIAVKQMRRSGNREENKRITMDLEVVLKSHDCPYIVQCLGCFVTESDVWICMELMATCFDKLLKRVRQPIAESIIGKVAVATVRALHYLKEKHGVIHRDVKPSNILLDEKGNVKLCDFGISGWLEDSKAKTRSAGCAAYMAPERIEPPDPSHPDYDIRADVWSLGITLVELATGNSPYRNCQTDFEVLASVVRDDPPLLTQSQGFSPELCSFVKDCLTKNYKHRPKYKKLLEHPFIKKYEDMPVDVSAWYATVTRPNELQNNPMLVRQSPQRTSQRFAPPSPSLRRVTSEPPPIPPRTPESQRKPLLIRLASEPVVEGLDLQTVNGRITIVGSKAPASSSPSSSPSSSSSDTANNKPPAGKVTPSSAPPVPSQRFILPLRPPTLPPRPPPQQPPPPHPQQTSPASQDEGKSSTQRLTSPPGDLPGLPPRPPATVTEALNGSSVARLAQFFGAQLSPARSPTQSNKDPYEAFNLPAVKTRTSLDPPATPPPAIPPRLSPESSTPQRSILSDGLLARLSQDPNLARFLKSSSPASSAESNRNGQQHHHPQQPPTSLFGRRISSEGILSRRYWYSPSPPQHPPPQPPIRGRSSHTSNAAGSSSVPASPILQPRHFGDNGGGGGGSIGTSSNPFCPPPGYVLPRHLTPEPQRRNLGQRFEL